jgi:hypothetical protein
MIAAAAVAPLVSACNPRDELVDPQAPTVIDQGAVDGPTGANGLRVGALGAFKMQTGSGETLWQLGGLLADEWKSSNSAAATNEIDRRSISTSNTSVTIAYTGIQQARGYFRDAINAMVQWVPDDSIARSRIGELYFGVGFLEMQMAEALCNGVPIGEVRDGLPVYGASKTNADLLALAGAHLDSALALAVAKDTAYSVKIRNAALITKARILVDLGQFANAATLSAQVPTNYQYTLTFSTASGLNGNWSLNTSQNAYSVSDSLDASGVLKNAIPFVSAKDVRVPTANANKTGIDGTTPLFTTSIWANTGQIPVVSGVDARLIDAEAKLNANDIAGMMTILNGLRTAAQTLGTFRPAAQAALPTPATQAAATTVFFREKAFWAFGRGQRLGDLRRMIRQYKLSQDQVFPNGNYYKGGAYGSDVNFPVPDVERANPQFAGCLDRNA